MTSRSNLINEESNLNYECKEIRPTKHGLRRRRMEEPNYVYGDAEREIVKSGYEAIEAVLVGHDVNAKRRLLFYLDWYIDPYYKHDLTDLYKPLKDLL